MTLSYAEFWQDNFAFAPRNTADGKDCLAKVVLATAVNGGDLVFA